MQIVYLHNKPETSILISLFSMELQPFFISDETLREIKDSPLIVEARLVKL